MPPSTSSATIGPVAARTGTVRSRWWLVAAVAVVATLLPPVTPAATADAGIEAAFVDATNRERSEQGRAALTTAPDLTSVARAHSRRMADSSDLHHNPGLGDDVTGWTKVGENVGRGGSIEAIHAALMDSTSHRRNLLDADWSETGIGVVVADGTIWVTQLFRKPATRPAASQAPTSPGDDRRASPAERPLPMDRTTLTLARRSAAEEDVSAGDLLVALFERTAAA